MPLRKPLKSSSKGRKAYPKRKTVRTTVMQRAKTLEYSADPVPPKFSFKPVSEQKYLDNTQSNQVSCRVHPGLVDIIHLNQVTQGSSVNSRNGMRYQMTGIHLRGLFHQQGAQSLLPVITGYWLVYDSEPHGAKPAASDIFNLKFDNMAFAFPNGSEGQKGGRFKYLYRKSFILGNAGSGTNPVEMDGATPGLKILDDFIPMNKLETQHMRLDQLGGISHIQKGALLLIPFSRTYSTVTGDDPEPPLMEFTYRMYFTE